MAIDRRSFTAGSVALLASAAASTAASSGRRNIIAATTRNPDASHSAVIYDIDTGPLRITPLPMRGHDITIDPVAKTCVAFARRPGNFAVAFGLSDKRKPITFHAPHDRHFYGHGVFARDGRLLYTTENDFQKGIGVLGVWDAMNRFRRVGELPSHGVGPHDINLLSDDRTLVVANGGIQTHPDYGRQPLNLATMTASLVYIDRATGDLLDRQELDLDMKKVSIRHLDIALRDTVIFGCQFKGARSQRVDLVGFHRRGERIHFLSRTPSLHRALRHYVSSIAVDRSGEMCAVTSSRGQHCVLIDVEQRRVVGMQALRDVSGIAPAHQNRQFVATSGTGRLAINALRQSSPITPVAPWSWDNHAVRYDL